MQLYLLKLTHPEAHCPALDPDELEKLVEKLESVDEIFADVPHIEILSFFGKPAKHTFWCLVRFAKDKPYSYYAREFKKKMGLRVWRIDEEIVMDVQELIPFFKEDVAAMRQSA